MGFIEERLLEWDVSADVRNRACLAADEYITNIVLYAYPNATGRIRISLGRDTSSVWVTINDHGIPFDPTDQPAPDTTIPIEERTVGGLGIFLAGKIVGDVSYSRANGTNELTLTIKTR